MPRIHLHLSQEIEAGRHLPLQHKLFVFCSFINIIVSGNNHTHLYPELVGRASLEVLHIILGIFPHWLCEPTGLDPTYSSQEISM